MSNELLWFLFLLVDFGVSLLAVYLFGRNALYVIIATDIIICNIQVLKIIDIFGLVATVGNILYGSIFLATDLLSEVYGKQAARRGVWLGFFALIFATISMQLALLFTPHPDDFSQPALQQIFGFMPRVVVASLIAYLISQHHDVWAFHFWKEKTAGRFLWLRNNASTWVSQAIDSIVFVTIAFYGVFSPKVLLSVLVTTYLLKLMIALLDTPIVYLGRWMLTRHERRFGTTSL